MIKVGDSVRVVDNKYHSGHPDELRPLVSGDVVVVDQIKVGQWWPNTLEFTAVLYKMNRKAMVVEHATIAKYLGYNFLPLTDVEPAASVTEELVCKCDVWISGCKCGAFQREMAK